MKITTDTFDDQIVISKMRKSGYDDSTDHADFFNTDWESTAGCGIFIFIQEPVSESLF